MQFLYVLASSENDFYYEQFLLSITSLKFFTPNADIILLCDSKTKETLAAGKKEYEKLNCKIISVDAPADMLQIDVSRWLKTSMRRFLSGDFLFVDCDTVIAEDLSSSAELIKSGIKFAACLDKHSLISRHALSDNIIKNEKKLGFNAYFSDRHYNSGVIFCADAPETHKIFNRWHELWIFGKGKNISRDQTSFNIAIQENLSYFTELDGIWNCQIGFNGLPYLSESKIIHYFASDLTFDSSPFILASNETFKQMKETGLIPIDVQKLLGNPRAAFVPESRIIADEVTLLVIHSSFFEMICWIRKKIPPLFHFMNSFSSFLKKIVKYFLIKSSRKKSGGTEYYY